MDGPGRGHRHAQTSVLYARRLLETYQIRHLPVAEGSRVVGMLSDRDLRIVDRPIVDSLSALQLDLVHGRYRPVDTLMAQPVHVAFPQEQVSGVVRLVLTLRIGALPVVDGGRLVGLITLTDCLLALLARQAAAPQGDGISSDPDAYKVMAMPAADDRPGRPSPAQPTAEQAVDISSSTRAGGEQRSPQAVLQEPVTTTWAGEEVAA